MKWLTFSSTNQNLPFHFLLLETLIIKTVWQAFVFNAEYFSVGENQEQGSSEKNVLFPTFSWSSISVHWSLISNRWKMSHSKQIKERRSRSTSLGVSTLVPHRQSGHGGRWARVIRTFSNLFSDISHSTIQSYHRWSLLVKPLSKLIIKQKLLQQRLQLIVDLLRWVRI